MQENERGETVVMNIGTMRRRVGARVEMHAASDAWMRGDRFGEIVGVGNRRDYRDSFTGKVNSVRPYRVKLDKSGRVVRVHPENLHILD